MTKKSPLRSAIGAIESSKPTVWPRNQSFTPPPIQNLNPDSGNLGGQTDHPEKDSETNTLKPAVPDNRDTENQSPDNQVPDLENPDYQDTQNQESETQHPENKNPDYQEPENQPSENQGGEGGPDTESLLFGRASRKDKLREESDRLRKPKSKGAKLKRKEATKDQIASFINPKHSRPQRFMQLAEEDALDLLQGNDHRRALKGNDWPVFLFMSLKAYEWDNQQQKRRDGKRNFATEYVAKGTGVSESTAFEVINRLIAKGYVKPIEASARGNVYHVSPVLCYRPSIEGSKKPRDNRSESPGDQDQGSPKSENSTPRKSGSDHRKSEDQSTDNRGTHPPIIGDPVHRKSETIIDRVHFLDRLDILNLSLIENHFEEIYFSEIRAPQVVEDERRAFRAIIGRNGDVTLEEFLECFEVMRKKTDEKGNAVVKKFVWMAGGFDRILKSARASLRDKQRRAEAHDESPATSSNLSQETAASATAEAQLSHEQPIESFETGSVAEFRNPTEIQARDEVQNRVDSLTQEIFRLENRYSVNLAEDDLAKMKILRNQREELYLANADLLEFNSLDFWTDEVKRLDRVINAISALHAKYPISLAEGIRHLNSIKSALLIKISNRTQETELIRKQISESLGLKEEPPIQLAVG